MLSVYPDKPPVKVELPSSIVVFDVALVAAVPVAEEPPVVVVAVAGLTYPT